MKYRKPPQYRQKGSFSLPLSRLTVWFCTLDLKSHRAHLLPFPFIACPFLFGMQGWNESSSYIQTAVFYVQMMKHTFTCWGLRLKLRTRKLQKLNSCFLNTLYGKNTAKIFFCSKRKKYTAMVMVLRMT